MHSTSQLRIEVNFFRGWKFDGDFRTLGVVFSLTRGEMVLFFHFTQTKPQTIEYA